MSAKNTSSEMSGDAVMVLLFLCLSVCLFPFVSICLSVYLSLSVRPSVRLCLSVCLSVSFSLSLSLSVSVSLSLFVSIYLSICLCPSVRPSVSLSLSLSYTDVGIVHEARVFLGTVKFLRYDHDEPFTTPAQTFEKLSCCLHSSRTQTAPGIGDGGGEQ